jgi:hypothetical protein
MVGGSLRVSSTTKTGRHDIAESGIKHNESNQSYQMSYTDSETGEPLVVIIYWQDIPSLEKCKKYLLL